MDRVQIMLNEKGKKGKLQDVLQYMIATKHNDKYCLQRDLYKEMVWIINDSSCSENRSWGLDL